MHAIYICNIFSALQCVSIHQGKKHMIYLKSQIFLFFSEALSM